MDAGEMAFGALLLVAGILLVASIPYLLSGGLYGFTGLGEAPNLAIGGIIIASIGGAILAHGVGSK